MSWSTVKLSKVAPSQPLKVEPIDGEQEVWQLNLNHIEPNTGKLIEYDIQPYSKAGNSTHWFDERYVLYSKLRPYLNKVILPTQQGLGTTELVPMLPNEKCLNRKYLAYYLRSKSFVDWVSTKTAGAKMPRVSMKTFWDHEIPLPSLAEQQKIASILDAADSLRQKDQQLIEKYTELSQSLFLEMFGDPVSNPMGWDIETFGKSLIDIIGGKSVGGEQRQIKENEMAVLKISAVTTGNFNSAEYKVVDNQQLPEELIHPQKGDLLFSRANTRELVGATCVVDTDYEYLFLPDKLWKLILKLDMASNCYIKFLLTHDGFRENLRKVATGTSGSMLNISKAKLKQLKIPVPPINLQNQFAERIQVIEAQKQHALASLQKSEDLFNSLLQRAFKGELTT